MFFFPTTSTVCSSLLNIPRLPTKSGQMSGAPDPLGTPKAPDDLIFGRLINYRLVSNVTLKLCIWDQN